MQTYKTLNFLYSLETFKLNCILPVNSLNYKIYFLHFIYIYFIDIIALPLSKYIVYLNIKIMQG